MAVVVISACAFIPVACADDAQEPSPQVTETPAVESQEPEVILAGSETKTVVAYDVPLDLELQLFIIQLCEDHHIDPAIVIAMIERESKFDANAIGDGGESFGLMQIQPKWHQERMDKLGVTDLLNPYQNVTVGVDYLAELCERYECIGMALMAYNAGSTGAKNNWWDKGIFENAYSSGVLERSEALTEGMVEYVLD